MSEHRKRTTRVELREDLRRVLAPRRELRDSVKTSVLAYAAKRRATPSRRRRVIPMPRRIAAAAAIAAAVALLLIAP